MNLDVMKKLTYGLFVLTARDGQKDNGCIINTAVQVASEPNTISISVNKANYTHDMILKTGKFNVSILSEEAKFDTFKHFGFQSGRDVDKFAEVEISRADNGIAIIHNEQTNGYLSGKVIQSIDLGSHTLFIATMGMYGMKPLRLRMAIILPTSNQNRNLKNAKAGFARFVDTSMKAKSYQTILFVRYVSIRHRISDHYKELEFYPVLFLQKNRSIGSCKLNFVDLFPVDRYPLGYDVNFLLYLIHTQFQKLHLEWLVYQKERYELAIKQHHFLHPIEPVISSFLHQSHRHYPIDQNLLKGRKRLLRKQWIFLWSIFDVYVCTSPNHNLLVVLQRNQSFP